MNSIAPLRIATRGSALALWQANRLREAVERAGGAAEIVVVKTSGDHFAAASFDQIGVQGVFTKELEEALFDGRADVAVHSMKDVPTEFSSACRILPIFPRDDPRDALVSDKGETLEQLRQGARIGTSSLRRASQLRAFRHDLEICEIRGNVDTRLRKVEQGEYDGVVLAKAGLDRLGLSSRVAEILPPEVMLPAVGQGVLCAEYCEPQGDLVLPLLKSLVDRDTLLAVNAERALLKDLQGGCRVPLGAWARFEEGKLRLDVCVLSPDGAESVRRSGARLCTSVEQAAAFGRSVAKELLNAGADRILRLAGRSVGQA
ncbi:MAG TPA: hydroxymethylbilane synthase [Candidatus Acidoferrum sp.]|nr:hydroxymethylbilane synthase [Candidatus Acidoferrum sp.]